jgi:poly(A) polymerase
MQHKQAEKQLKQALEKLRRARLLAWTRKVYVKPEARVFLVGGAVRDILLKREGVVDYDFVVQGWEIDELEKFLAGEGKVNLVGKRFGVFKFMPKGKKGGEPLDIALPRTELSLASGGYRDFKVNFKADLPIEEDLGRRDFTVNAMAYELKGGYLVDKFGGLDDLKNKTIKTVGNAYERFEEDYSRMLRALRFACQLHWQIDKTTFTALKKLVSHLNDERENERVVPYEVIASELLKSFTAYPVKAFDLYDKSGVLRQLMPELLKMQACPQPANWHSEGDVWEHTRLCLKNLTGAAFKKRFKRPFIKKEVNANKACKISAELVMAVLWHDVGKAYTIQTPEKDGTDRIRFNNHDVVGAEIARKRFKRLKLSAAEGFDFQPERAAWLIAKHHLFDPRTVKAMKNSTIEKYFFSDKYNGEDLLKLGFVDILSSVWAKDDDKRFEGFELMLKRIDELKKAGKGRQLPKPLLNGDEVMELLKLRPGRQVGEILDILREKQLSGEVKNKQAAIKLLDKIKRSLKK